MSSSLEAQLAAFKQRQLNQPVLPRAVVRLQNGASALDGGGSSNSGSGDGPKYVPSPSERSTPDPNQQLLQQPKKRQKTSVVYSQPQDTGRGQHLFTRLTYAVDYLRSLSEPVPADKIASHLSTTMTPTFIHLLRINPKITYHADTDLYEFRPMHNIRNPASLLATLANQPTAAGLAVKDLKDGYPAVEEDLRTLETQGRVLVIRGKRDDLARMVWANDPALNVAISDEFKATYHSLKVPDPADLPRELEKANMKPASIDPRTVKRIVVEKEKKKRGRRRGKITNTHLAGILRDYSQ